MNAKRFVLQGMVLLAMIASGPGLFGQSIPKGRQVPAARQVPPMGIFLCLQFGHWEP